MLIETRRAADLLGATKMDRPEDIEPNPQDGNVYVMLTNNTKRKADQVDAANPRAENAFGHIIEIVADRRRPCGHQAFNWEMLVKCGDPSVAEVGATFSTETTKNGWFGMPDNCAIDSAGRLWIATDGNNAEGHRPHRRPLGASTPKARRGHLQAVLPRTVGAEMCGPLLHRRTTRRCSSPSSIPATAERTGKFGATFDYEDPSTRWPDFKDGMPAASVGRGDHQTGRRQDRVGTQADTSIVVVR